MARKKITKKPKKTQRKIIFVGIKRKPNKRKIATYTSRFNITWSRKKSLITLAVISFIVMLSVVPKTRYVLPKLIIHNAASFVLVDAHSGFRVSEASVTIGNNVYTSDESGIVRLPQASPGRVNLQVSKPFYTDYKTTATIAILKSSQQFILQLQPLGQPTKITVKNKLSARRVLGVKVKTAHGATAKTNADGEAELLMPFGVTSEDVTLEGEGILSQTATLRIAQDDSTNVYFTVPKGFVYFLSNASGTLDIAKAQLDGSNKQVVLAGTGLEVQSDTLLLASKDWKYLALKSSRDGTSKLYIYTTATGELTAIDSTNLVDVTGWIDDFLVYKSTQSFAPLWQPKRTQLLSYDAVAKKPIILKESGAEGNSVLDYVAMEIRDVFLVQNKVMYTERWSGSYYYGNRFANKRMTLTQVSADGTSTSVIHEWQAGYNAHIDARPNNAGELYVHIELDGVQHSYWRYYKGSITQQDDLIDVFLNDTHRQYLDSPNSTYTIWTQQDNSVTSLFMGDSMAKNAKLLDTLSSYEPYGWYTDDYILLTDAAKTLYAVGREGIKPGIAPLKITTIFPASHAVRSYIEGYQR